MAIRIVAVFLLCLLAGIWGCEQSKESESGAAKSAVEVTDAYRRYFGEPPGTLGGACFGMVGYYPLQADPLQVRPVPHFTFSEQNRPQLLLAQMLQGAEPWGLQNLYLNPFPPGTALLSVTFNGVTAVADFSPQLLELREPLLQQSVLTALGHALTQFKGVDNILVTVEGQPVPFQPQNGFRPDEKSVAPPGPPAILQAVLNDGENAEAAETLVFFDRPVKAKTFRLEDGQGRLLEGDYFSSVFDMALVLHPKHPERIQIGQRLKIIWRVVDGKGRENAGETTLEVVPLSRSAGT